MKNETNNIFELDERLASGMLWINATNAIFSDLVNRFANFKVSARHMDYFKSKVLDLNHMKIMIQTDFESKHARNFDCCEFFPLDQIGIDHNKF